MLFFYFVIDRNYNKTTIKASLSPTCYSKNLIYYLLSGCHGNYFIVLYRASLAVFVLLLGNHHKLLSSIFWTCLMIGMIMVYPNIVLINALDLILYIPVIFVQSCWLFRLLSLLSQWLHCCWFIVYCYTSLWGFCVWSLFCYVVLCALLVSQSS